MRLHDYLDKGASLGADRPCLTTDGASMSYADVVGLSHEVAAALLGRGVGAGGRVAILSANDPVAFTCVFGISRAGGVWCPINPRNEAAENRELLELFGAEVVLYQSGFAPLVATIRDELPGVHTWVCLDSPDDGSLTWQDFLASGSGATVPDRPQPPGVDELAMLVGTGGTTGRPKGVMLTPTNLETMTALTLMGYPFDGPPVYLALAPLTHAAGVLCFPVLSLGGEVVIMRAPDVGGFLRLVAGARRHAHVPAADADLHGARQPPPRVDGPEQPPVLLVRRGPDVGVAARGGADPDRAGHGAALRPDRGADDDLDDAARRPLPRRRLGGDRATHQRRSARTAGDGRDPRRGRPAGGAGGARRDLRAVVAGDGGLLARTRRRPPARSATGGCTPATSGSSTTRASSTSSTGPRT